MFTAFATLLGATLGFLPSFPTLFRADTDFFFGVLRAPRLLAFPFAGRARLRSFSKRFSILRSFFSIFLRRFSSFFLFFSLFLVEDTASSRPPQPVTAPRSAARPSLRLNFAAVNLRAAMVGFLLAKKRVIQLLETTSEWGGSRHDGDRIVPSRGRYMLGRMISWYVYILRCRDRTFYTGITVDLGRRLESHARGVGAKYTCGRRPVTLVYEERQPDRSSALKREAALRRLGRAGKLALIATCQSLRARGNANDAVGVDRHP